MLILQYTEAFGFHPQPTEDHANILNRKVVRSGFSIRKAFFVEDRQRSGVARVRDNDQEAFVSQKRNGEPLNQESGHIRNLEWSGKKDFE